MKQRAKDNVQLHPCPYCGQSDFLIERLDFSSSVVICQGLVDEHSACLARGPVGIQDDDGEDQPGKDAAIREWNRRAQLAMAEGVDRQRMIESMCLTWRHDFGLDKPADCQLSSGMTGTERHQLRGRIGRLFDHHFAPALSAVTAERDRLREDRDSQQRVCIAEMEKANQLRAEVEALRAALFGIASVNPAERGIEWAKAHASDGLKGAGSELYARWIDAFNEAEALKQKAEG